MKEDGQLTQTNFEALKQGNMHLVPLIQEIQLAKKTKTDMISNRTKKNKYDEPWDPFADSQDSHESADSDSSDKKQKRTMAKETY